MKAIVTIIALGLTAGIGLLGISCSKDDDSSPTGTGGNHAPVIRSVTANPTTVSRGCSSTLICVATDADSDSLSYYWACSTADFYPGYRGTEQSTEMLFRELGMRYAIVTVSDGKDVAIDSVGVTVQ